MSAPLDAHDNVAPPSYVNNVEANNTSNEKTIHNKDSDSSSGNVENLETVPQLEYVDKATERAVLRKLDYRIVPMIMWVYLMNMMDRGEHHRTQETCVYAKMADHSSARSQHWQRPHLRHGE